MKRSPMPRGTTPMKRTAFARSGSAKGRRDAVLTRGSRAASEYMARVSALGCAICRLLGFGPTPAEVHHQREGTGGGRRAADEDTIPLCPSHHRGNEGIHGLGSKLFALTYGVTESELVAKTQEELGWTA